MESSRTQAPIAETFRCAVCGREFRDADALEQHVRDQGLLW